jgi:REP-associated tyrosine transposase
MPNHFHLVLEPAHQAALSQFMQWLLTSHVRRYHKHSGSTGHIWQGRFKSFPVQRDERLTTVLGYVLQNPVRAGLSNTYPHTAQKPLMGCSPLLFGCWFTTTPK